MSEELKPCKNCGGVGHIWKTTVGNPKTAYCKCGSCSYHTDVYAIEEVDKVVAEWNRREDIPLWKLKQKAREYLAKCDAEHETKKYKIGNEQYVCVAPLPCVRVVDKEVKAMPIKKHFAKINEELDELKEAVSILNIYRDLYGDRAKFITDDTRWIAEEAADTITAITTMLEALGIDAEMRNEAQRRVNEKNRERGRL